jgi:ATP-dependent Lon protease
MVVKIEQDVVQDIVRYYTREAGVRSLEREISKICRKVVKELLLKEKLGHVRVDSSIVSNSPPTSVHANPVT